MSSSSMLLRQLVFENRAFWRNPAAAFFTFFFPLMFLFLFPIIFGGGEITRNGITIDVVTFYVPAIATFSLITACYTNLAMTLTFAREAGVLKRKRCTPLPPVVYMAGKIAHATLIGLILVAIVVVVGVVFHDVGLPVDRLGFVVAIVVGTVSFSALAIAITGFVPNEDAAPAIINFSILPLLFISDVFIPLQESTPEWLIRVAEIFPIYHFAQAMITAYLGFGDGFAWDHLAVMAAWAVFGIAIALRRFGWEPRR